MPERQSRLSDNKMIDRMRDESLGNTSDQETAGGAINRNVGSRAELRDAQGKLQGEEVERVTGSDDPDRDAQKGNKAFDKIRSGQQNG